MAEQISAAEYERQAAEYTGEMVERLNAAVRAQPSLGARSSFFQDPANVARGLPVFQGKHTRFVYDDDDDEIVAAVDVTQEALQSGPRVRTVAELDADIEDASDEEEKDEEEEDDYYDDEAEAEEEGDEGDETGVHNEFYVAEGEDADEEMAIDDAQVSALLQDVEMELAAVALDQQQLLARAAAATASATPPQRPAGP